MTEQYPQRTFTHQLEEISERFFINSLPRNWLAEKPRGDYGVDLRVDIFDGSDATGLELLIQLKSSMRANKSENETVSLRVSTYNYLRNKLQVAMFVKFIEEENEAYWILLKDVSVPNQAQDTFTLRIPKSNRLSSIDWSEIQSYISIVTDVKLAANRRNQLRENGSDL